MPRSEREHLGEGIVQHYANIGKKKKSITMDQFLWQMFHVKPSIVLSASTMTHVDYQIEMIAICCYYRPTKMLFSTFVCHLSFMMK